MKNMKFLFLLTIICCAIQVTAQENQNYFRSLSLQFGAGHLSRQDRILSPFVMQDFSPLNFQLEYRKTKKVLQKINLSLGLYKPILGESFTYYWPGNSQPQQTYPHNFTLVQANYSLAKKINLSTNKNQFYVGGIFMNNVNATPYNYGPFGTFGYFASFGFGPWLSTTKIIYNRKFTFDMSMPLLAWTARSPYLANDDEYIMNTYSHSGVKTFFAYLADGKLQTLNRFQNISISASYELIERKRCDFGLIYRFDFMHHSKPLPLWNYNHIASLSAKYKF